MSAGKLSRQASRSSISHSSRASERLKPPGPTLPADDLYKGFEPCAASASFFLYAQGNVISCLHHDTLAIERKFDAHREDVLIIAVDNVSDRGAGRVVVSYDATQTAIVWDLFTGDELARFASYEHIRVAKFQRDGTIAFGDNKGNIILFDFETSEHLSTRTIFDPITALAPAGDLKTFAVGYLNGTVLVAAVQPVFTILHTLNSTRHPSPIAELAWHASSSKQKTEMLATQTVDGDLRVWSVAKAPHNEPPRVIRQLGSGDNFNKGFSWFAWSKSGRIIQHYDGETKSWDVRTKQVGSEKVPTIDHITGIANYGPNATLFTLGGNHTVQQYDLNPNTLPLMVANVQHVPTNAPPSPPDSIEAHHQQQQQQQEQQQHQPQSQQPKGLVSSTFGSSRVSALPIELDVQSSEDDGQAMSPLEKIAREIDQLEEERRDCLGPLSPVSSHTSLSSASSYGRQRRGGSSGSRNKSYNSKMSDSTGYNGTSFSELSSVRSGSAHHSMSLQSVSSGSSFRPKGSSHRREIPKNLPETDDPRALDLFPFVKARLGEVPFRTPQLPQGDITTDILRQEMLLCIFGWDDDIESLIRDEQSRHERHSSAAVLLSKWLGDLGADNGVQLVGSKSMTSSDWMLLALSSMGAADSQKKMAETFLLRLLETGEVHPAVAIFLGLGELNDAVEVYVSRKYYLEAVLLTCLIFPADWQRISYLVRQWGEAAVARGQHELAVRCFSCTSMTPSEPWFSPRAQDAMYAASMQSMESDSLSPMYAPHAAALAHRLSVKNAGLKLNTDFTEKSAAHKTPKSGKSGTAGITPIADTAGSPATDRKWHKSSSRGNSAFPDSASTATPGTFGRRRLPSVGKKTPQTAIEEFPANNVINRKATPEYRGDSGSYRSRSDKMPSPAQAIFAQLRENSRSRNDSRDRNARGLQLAVLDTVEDPSVPTPHPLSADAKDRRYTQQSLASSMLSTDDNVSPLPTGSSLKSSKGRSIDDYINSLEAANSHARARSLSNSVPHQRSNSRDGRTSRGSKAREPSEEGRGRSGTRYIKPAKRSPSSPVALSSDQTKLLQENYDDERYYGVKSPKSPAEPVSAGARPRIGRSLPRGDGMATSRPQSPDARPGARSGSKSKSQSRTASRSRANSRARLPEELTSPVDDRGRSKQRGNSGRRASSSPSPPEALGDMKRTKSRQSSSRNRRPSDSGIADRNRDRSSSRKPSQRESSPDNERPAELRYRNPLTKKELAAKELEDRRLSLARRPSAPTIPLPGEISAGRSPLSAVDNASPLDALLRRSQTVDPDSMSRGPRVTGTSTSSTPIGLPATPRAMRHPRYMSSEPDGQDNVPAVPALPNNAEKLLPISYNAEQKTGADNLAPLLPATTFKRPAHPPRSSSAPPVQSPPMTQVSQFENTFHRGHVRKASDREGPSDSPSARRASPPYVDVISEETHEDITVVKDSTISAAQSTTVAHPPILLPELQHLAGPPQQPSSAHTSISSKNSTLINIGLDGSPNSRTTTPATDVTSPNGSRKPDSGASPVSAGTGSIASKWRNVADRMRSNSRNRARATPDSASTPSPYETQLSPMAFTRATPDLPSRNGTADSATLSATTYSSNANNIPPPPPPIPAGGSILEHGAPFPEKQQQQQQPRSATADFSPTAGSGLGLGLPTSSAGRPEMRRSNSAFAVSYRNPKELRANMPPETLQAGVYKPEPALFVRPEQQQQQQQQAVAGQVEGGMI